MSVVFERWYGQGLERPGLNRRARIDPTCEMVVGPSVACGRLATERVDEIAMNARSSVDEYRRYPSSMYWCPEHAALLRSKTSGPPS